MSRIEVKGVSLTYPNAKSPTLCGVNCRVEQARITLLLGRSGSGKTTLLRVMLGLVKVDEGEIDRCWEPGRVGYVPQGCDLFPHLTVLQNCVQPQRVVLKRRKQEAVQTAEAILERVGMGAFAGRMPHELSGGQRQKVAIARALALGAQVLLLDEPSSALDPTSTEELIQILQSLKEEGIGIALSTHDLSLAVRLEERAYLIEEGRVVASQEDTKHEIISTYLQGVER